MSEGFLFRALKPTLRRCSCSRSSQGQRCQAGLGSVPSTSLPLRARPKPGECCSRVTV